jgi:uncharacterized membrane protein (DUF2068 family)
MRYYEKVMVPNAEPAGGLAEVSAAGSSLRAGSATKTVVGQRAPTLYLIIADKLFKGILSLLLAFGVYKMAGINLLGLFDRFVAWMHFDPENRFLTDVGNLIDEITPANMRWVATGTMLYGILSFVEGWGLALRAPWASWLAIGESAFFIPIEIFELVHRRVLNHPAESLFSHRQIGLFVVLACNILIVWYLYANRKRLFHHRH